MGWTMIGMSKDFRPIWWHPERPTGSAVIVPLIDLQKCTTSASADSRPLEASTLNPDPSIPLSDKEGG
jgi:hypothetical protein